MKSIFESAKLILLCLAALLASCGGGEEYQTELAPQKTPTQVALAAAEAAVAEPIAAVTSIRKTGERRLDRTNFEYTFAISIATGVFKQLGLTAELVQVGDGSSIVAGIVPVGDVAPGAAISPKINVVVRHNRAKPFDVSAWRWSFKARELSGRVIDGYIRGAIVYWDCNGNNQRDATEPLAVSGAGGQYSVNAAYESECQLKALVPQGAIDESDGLAVERQYSMVAVKGVGSIITPLTTLVSTGAYTWQEIQAKIGSGVSLSLTDDYIAAQDAGADYRQAAKVIAGVLQSLGPRLNVIPDIDLASLIRKTMDYLPRNDWKSIDPVAAQASLPNFGKAVGPLASSVRPWLVVDEAKVAGLDRQQLDVIRAAIAAANKYDVWDGFSVRWAAFSGNSAFDFTAKMLDESIFPRTQAANDLRRQLRDELAKSIEANSVAVRDFRRETRSVVMKTTGVLVSDVMQGVGLAYGAALTPIASTAKSAYAIKNLSRIEAALTKTMETRKIFAALNCGDFLFQAETLRAMRVFGMSEQIKPEDFYGVGRSLIQCLSSASNSEAIGSFVTFTKMSEVAVKGVVFDEHDVVEAKNAFITVLVPGFFDLAGMGAASAAWNATVGLLWSSSYGAYELNKSADSAMENLMAQLNSSSLVFKAFADDYHTAVLAAQFDHYTNVAAISAAPIAEIGVPISIGLTADPQVIGGTVVWDYGDGSGTTTGQIGVHAYGDPGEYTVKATVTAPGCQFGSKCDGGLEVFVIFSKVIVSGGPEKKIGLSGNEYQIILCGTWIQCRDAALAKGGQLLTVRSQAENDWLKANFPMSEHYWIGATNDGVPGAWRWVSGEAFGYSNWGANLNNLGGNENCGHFYSVTPSFWNDVRCDEPSITKAVVEYAAPSTSSLYAHFKFDNNLLDAVAPRPGLSLVGALSPMFATRGASGAVSLLSGQYLANSSGMLTPAMAADGNHSFSVATHVKFDAWAGQTNAIVYERAYGGADPCIGPTYGISNYNNGGRKWLMLISTRNDQGGCVNEELWSTVDASLGQWYHVAGTYDQTTGRARLYVNGAVVAEKVIAKRLSLASNPFLSIGQQPWGGDQFIRGALDDLRFYRGALSASEVAAMAGTSGTSCAVPVKAVTFSEDFADVLNPARWDVATNGGSVTSSRGSVTLSTVGSKTQFPSIATTSDVIPASGNFSLFCRAKYTNTGPYGAGACVATRNLVDAAANANYGGYIGVWGGGPSVYSWGFDSSGSRLYFAEVGAGANETHDYETCVIDGEVTSYIDGKLVATAAITAESLRPRRIWLGHPGSAAAPNTWVTVETSKVEVRQLQTGNTGSATVLANTIPGATMTVPAGTSSCTFTSTGSWSAGPNAPPQYQNADGVVGGNSLNLTNVGVPIPSAPNMALVVKHSSTGNWDLLGSSKTIPVVAGETLSFMMNDATTFGYTDGNTGQLTTAWTCQ